MIRLSFNTSDERVLAVLREKGPQIIDGLVSKLNLLMLKLQQHIVRDKLSGQVLHHRSGKLAGSITEHPVTHEGTQIVGRVTGAGGPAFYGRFHEEGVPHSWTIVPRVKKALAFFMAGATASSKTGILIIRGMRQTTNLRRRSRAIKAFHAAGGVVVKSVVHPPLPQRSFMASSLEDMRSEIIEQLQLTVRGVVMER